MAFALTNILCAGREILAGEEIPAKVTHAGRERDVDVAGLVERGLASKTKPRAADLPE